MMNIGDTKTATITLFDADGNSVVHQGKSKFTFGKTRISGWCAANQRQLNELVAQNPKTVKATIDDSNFNVVNGKSYWVS